MNTKLKDKQKLSNEIYTVLPVVSAPNIQLYNIDNLEYMRKCKDNEFDLAIVDPPYIMRGNKYTTLNKKFIKDGHVSACLDRDSSSGISLGLAPNKEYFDELFRISKNQIIFGMQYFLNYLKPTQCVLCWDKNNGKNSKHSDFELAWTSFDYGTRTLVLSNNTGDKIHPTQKPIRLYEWILKNPVNKFIKQGGKVLDTHLGSASIAIACHKHNIDLVGLEIDKEYFDNAVKRFENYRSQLTLF